MLNKKINVLLTRVVLFFLVALAVTGVYAARGLHGDGSFYMLSILTREGFTPEELARDYVLALTQFPAVWALKSGIIDLNALVRLHSFGLIVIPLIFWFGALAQQIKSNVFWLLLIAFSATYLSSGFFANGEYTTTYGMAAFYTSILLKEKISNLLALCICLTSFALIRSYEAMFYLAPLLLLITITRTLLLKADNRAVKLALCLSALFFILSFVVAARSILNPHSPGNLSGAIDFAPMIKKGHFIYLICSLLLAGIVYNFKNLQSSLIINILAIAAALTFAMNSQWWLSPEQHYRFRSISGLLLFFTLFSIAFFIFILKKDIRKIIPSLTFISISIFFTLYFSFVKYDFGYYNWSKIFERESLNLTLSTNIEKTLIYGNEDTAWDRGFNWSWSNPTLSIILRGKADIMILNHSTYHGWVPELNSLGSNPLEKYKRTRGLYGSTL